MELGRWLRQQKITSRIARKAIGTSERLGRHRWKIERKIAYLDVYRRLTIRYERNGHSYLGFLAPLLRSPEGWTPTRGSLFA